MPRKRQRSGNSEPLREVNDSPKRRQSATPSQLDGNACLLCCQSAPESRSGSSYDYNKLDLRTLGSHSAHYKCMLFACALPQDADPDDESARSDYLAGFSVAKLLKEAARGRRLRCSFCQRPGATVGCMERRCSRSYHLPCAELHGSLLLHTDNFTLHCRDHWPQRVLTVVREKAEAADTPKVECPVCLEDIQLHPIDNASLRSVLCSPCCRNCFCHRPCAQAYATSAGRHFLKCPLCNDSDAFVDALVQQGVEVPCKDASWELEGNAYAALSHRPRLCSHPDCPDPEVDHYGTWLLKICHLCGADAMHVACAKLKSGHHRWACATCSTALSNPPTVARTAGQENE